MLTSLSIASTRYIVGDLVRGRFPWREFILQAWFVTSVSLLPAILVAIPFGVIVATFSSVYVAGPSSAR